MDHIHLPSVGTRLSHNEYLATVRFVGPVHGTTGVWLGVEWDIPERGKHDGVKDGHRYFDCRVPNAGSFIRPSAHISYGTSFLKALVSKYIEVPHGSDTQEKVLLGSSQGVIQVEAVNLDKIRAKLSDLERLREVSLDTENVAGSDPPGTIRSTCPRIVGLDLSTSLLPSWDEVALITVELSSLQRLSLNRNRFQFKIASDVMRTAFGGLIELQLNGTLMSWSEMQQVTAFMPKLRIVEMGYNRLSSLSLSAVEAPSPDSAIETINLANNDCSDWRHVCESLKQYPCLQRGILTSNQIKNIPYPERPENQISTIKHLSLSNNDLRAWSDIDVLSQWFPALETLTLNGNPLVDDHELRKHSRAFIVARIPSLLTLDGAAISPKERSDCEIFYLSYVAKNEPASEDERLQKHPRWQQLCRKHGVPEESPEGNPMQDKLSNHLMELNMYRCSEPPRTDQPELTAFVHSLGRQSLRVLPNMTLRTLRMKICKAAKVSYVKARVRCWLKMSGNSLVELDTNQDSRALDWLGVENGSDIPYLVTEK